MKKAYKLNAPLRGLLVGSIIKLKVNDEGIPLDIYWKNRLVDAVLDNCIELVDKVREKKPSIKQKKYSDKDTFSAEQNKEEDA